MQSTLGPRAKPSIWSGRTLCLPGKFAALTWAVKIQDKLSRSRHHVLADLVDKLTTVQARSGATPMREPVLGWPRASQRSYTCWDARVDTKEVGAHEVRTS